MADAFYSDLSSEHSHLTCFVAIGQKAAWHSERSSKLQLLFWVSLDVGNQFACAQMGNSRLLLQPQGERTIVWFEYF